MKIKLSLAAARRRAPVLAGATSLFLGLTVGPAVTAPGVAASPARQAQASGLPEVPEDYAVAAFHAWVNGDTEMLERLAGPWVTHFLASRGPSPEDGSAEAVCEGAAGSTYCTWVLVEPDTHLRFQIRNETASAGEPDAVIAAEFVTAPLSVAIWPFTSSDEAENTQQSVDEGHSPWMLDPATVVTFYAESVLGWEGAQVEGDPEALFTMVDPATDVAAYAEVTQPARTGEGGIWAVTLAGVSEPTAEDPPEEPSDPESPVSPAPPAPPVLGDPGFTG